MNIAYNVRVPVVHIVRANSEKDAITKLARILEADGYYTWDESAEEGGPHAFEDENPDAGETIPDRWMPERGK